MTARNQSQAPGSTLASAPATALSHDARSLLSVTSLEMEEIGAILRLATTLEVEDPLERALRLAKRRVALLFYESSTRTRTSFELAAKSLGADTALISSQSSSIEKGESLKDTGITLRSLGAECIILRHLSSGAPYLLAQATGLPVLNAGDGIHEHPSQALLDLRTILDTMGRAGQSVGMNTLKDVTVTIVGDIFHSRVARSNLLLLPRLGARVILCGPPALLPEVAVELGPGITIERNFDRALPQSQIVMMLRIQKERLAGTHIDLEEYMSRYQLHQERLSSAAPEAIVMHPGPMIRGLEITSEVADGPQSVIAQQVHHGVAIRMALIYRALAPEPLSKPTGRQKGSPVESRSKSSQISPPRNFTSTENLSKSGEEGKQAVTAILIRGGRVVDPSAGVDTDRDVLLKDGRVAAIEPAGKLNSAGKQEGAEIVEAKGFVVAPGLVDIHVHLREPGQGYKETIATGTAAAAAGGFTSVCAMPNTVPVSDSVEAMRWMQSAERSPSTRVFPIAAATRGSMGEALTEYGSLEAAGAVGVSDDGKPILGEGIMRQALAAAARAGFPVIQHAEDTRLTGGCSMNAGALAFRLGLRGMPVVAEAGLVERDIRILADLKDGRAHLHVAHLSTAAALDAVRKARRNGLHVTCEVTPHHLVLTESAVGDYNTNAKMNPPLRTEADRRAMLEGLLDGSIDCIATDHAPHAAHEKEQEFERAPNGITGLESALGLAIDLLHRKHKVSLSRLITLLSTQPANLLNLRGRGTLATGSFADVVIFDPKAQWTFRAAATRSKSKNTPFEGWPMLGKVQMTISEGRVVYRAS